MSLQVENLEHNMVKLTIEVPAEELDAAIQKAFQKQRTRLNIPGFRKGKVPFSVVEKMFGVEVFYEEAANILIPDAYAKAYDECDFVIVSQPSIAVEKIAKGEPFVFTAEVAKKPEVVLGTYKGVEVDAVDTVVTEEEVLAELAKEQEKNARSIVVEGRPVQDKDEIKLDFEGFVEGVSFDGGKGENYPLTIGSGSFIPGFEEQLIGAMPETEVEVKVTFPEDYHSEDLCGKDATFKCTVHEIKEKQLPELDDEFASEVSEFETLADFKADLEKKLVEKKAEEGKKAQQDQAVEAIVAASEMDIPDAMIETEAREMFKKFESSMKAQGIDIDMYCQYTGTTRDAFLEEMKGDAAKRIRRGLTLDAIVAAESIEPTEERVEEEFKKLAEAYGMEVEMLKNYFGEDQLKQLKGDLAIEAALDMISENVVVK